MNEKDILAKLQELQNEIEEHTEEKKPFLHDISADRFICGIYLNEEGKLTFFFPNKEFTSKERYCKTEEGYMKKVSSQKAEKESPPPPPAPKPAPLSTGSWLTVKKAAEVLNCSSSHIYRAIKKGELETVIREGRTFVSRKSLDEYGEVKRPRRYPPKGMPSYSNRVYPHILVAIRAAPQPISSTDIAKKIYRMNLFIEDPGMSMKRLQSIITGVLHQKKIAKKMPRDLRWLKQGNRTIYWSGDRGPKGHTRGFRKIPNNKKNTI